MRLEWQFDLELGGNKASKLDTKHLFDLCKWMGEGECAKKDSKKTLLQKLLQSFELGPQLGSSWGEVERICYPGEAIAYDVEMKNPVWASYRLNSEEQEQTRNDRRSFPLDQVLKGRGVSQTNSITYTNTGFDKGHLAPSLAMSFDRKTLSKVGMTPWEACYRTSNIAPQYAPMNQRSWQQLEKALHTYAADLPAEDRTNVYVTAGVAYWNRDQPQHWDGEGECKSECTCDHCECRECADEHLQVPSFFWKTVCHPGVGSFAMIAENDPASNSLGEDGWPPSVFEEYTVEDVERFFDLNLNYPEECEISEYADLVPSWQGGHEAPKAADFTIELEGIGGSRVVSGEALFLKFTLPFGPAADGATTLTLTPGDDGWSFDCGSLEPHSLPRGECTGGSSLELELDRPAKGGTFHFSVRATAPKHIAGGYESWTAAVSGDDGERVLESSPLEVLYSAKDCGATVPKKKKTRRRGLNSRVSAKPKDRVVVPLSTKPKHETGGFSLKSWADVVRGSLVESEKNIVRRD